MTRKNERVIFGTYYQGDPVKWFRLMLWYKLLRLAASLMWPVLKRSGHSLRWKIIDATFARGVRSGLLVFRAELIDRYREQLGCSYIDFVDKCVGHGGAGVVVRRDTIATLVYLWTRDAKMRPLNLTEGYVRQHLECLVSASVFSDKERGAMATRLVAEFKDVL